MKNKIINFFNSEIYIILIYLLCFLNFINIINYTIYFPILTVIIFVYCVNCRVSNGIIPIILTLLISNVFGFYNDSFDVSEIMKDLNYPLIISCAIIVFSSLIYFYIKNRNKERRTSYLGISLFLIFISFLVSDLLMSKSVDFISYFLVFLLFYFIRNTINYYKMKEEFLPYFSRSFLYFGVCIGLQVVYYYLTNFNLDSPSNFAPNLGWSQHNGVALNLLLSLGIGSYILFYSEKSFYFPFLVFISFSVLLTTSRGGILALLLMIFILVIIFMNKFKDKKKLFYGISFVSLSYLILFIGFTPYFNKIFNLLFNDGFNDSGRFLLWKDAIKAFLNNIYIGSGSNIFPVDGNLWRPWFHSTIFDILGQLGLLGLFNFGIHFIVKYISIFKDRSSYKWFVFASLLPTALYGLIDVIYFSFQYFEVYVIILATIEYSSGYLNYRRND